MDTVLVPGRLCPARLMLSMWSLVHGGGDAGAGGLGGGGRKVAGDKEKGETDLHRCYIGCEKA